MDKQAKPKVQGGRRAGTESSQHEDRVPVFMTIMDAAKQARLSIRHFRRVIENDNIPICQIGRKFFLLVRDFDAWTKTRSKT